MRCFFGSLLLTLLLFNSAWAGVLKIAGGDVVWSSLDESSPTYYVLIFNEEGVADCLTSWQLCLKITPMEDATGSLQFASADLPRQFSENYLLYGNSFGLTVSPPPAPTGDTVSLGDSVLSGFGDVVPPSEEKKTLLKVDFSASEDAEGVFAISAVPGIDSFWISYYGPEPEDFTMMWFKDMPIYGSEPVVIGHVTVALVPEPHGFLLLLTVAGAFGCRVGRTRSNT